MVQTNNQLALKIGTVFIASQGFLNSLAMNEKMIQQFISTRLCNPKNRKEQKSVELGEIKVDSSSKRSEENLLVAVSICPSGTFSSPLPTPSV